MSRQSEPRQLTPNYARKETLKTSAAKRSREELQSKTFVQNPVGVHPEIFTYGYIFPPFRGAPANPYIYETTAIIPLSHTERRQ